MITQERICLCALNKIFGFVPKVGHLLLEHFGTATNIFAADPDSLRTIVGPNSKYLSQITGKALEEAEIELRLAEKLGSELIGVNDNSYPALLRECEDAPIALYVRSNSPITDIFNKDTAVAIVGTRDISPYGREWCANLVRSLAVAEKKPVIVSGLAYGTDIIAHSTAIECGLPTIAVMATGIERIYPFRHNKIAERMVSLPGCALLTDYPIGTIPVPYNFLRRNRIIAGLCEATIVIESKIKGGGMMTASFAYNYSRDVYALPGRIDDERSMGCNWLIGENRAEAIINPESLIEKLNLGSIPRRSSKSCLSIVAEHYSSKLGQSELEKLLKIYSLVTLKKEINVESLCATTGLHYQEIVYYTAILEGDNYISVDLMQNCRLNRFM